MGPEKSTADMQAGTDLSRDATPRNEQPVSDSTKCLLIQRAPTSYENMPEKSKADASYRDAKIGGIQEDDGAETGQSSGQDDKRKGRDERFDFGMGISRCQSCRSFPHLNRGCQNCRAHLCRQCFRSHACTVLAQAAPMEP